MLRPPSGQEPTIPSSMGDYSKTTPEKPKTPPPSPPPSMSEDDADFDALVQRDMGRRDSSYSPPKTSFMDKLFKKIGLESSGGSDPNTAIEGKEKAVTKKLVGDAATARTGNIKATLPQGEQIKDSIDTAKQLIKAGAPCLPTQNYYDIERELPGMYLARTQRSRDDTHGDEKPWQHVLSKFPQYTMEQKDFYNRLNDPKFSKPFLQECSKAKKNLEALKSSCPKEQKAELEITLKWLNTMTTAVEKDLKRRSNPSFSEF